MPLNVRQRAYICTLSGTILLIMSIAIYVCDTDLWKLFIFV